MPQIFHPSTNTLSRLTIFGSLGIVLGLLFLSYLIMQSPYQTQVRVVRPQPVPFSHEHHVRGLGIDCRYCHTSVETSAFAGLAADPHVHELPLADLGQQPDARAGANQPGREQTAQMDQGP